MRRQLIALGAVLVLALAGAAVGALAGRAAPAKTTLQVTEREFHITLAHGRITTGTVRLVVHNAGKLAHRLSIKGPGVRASTPLIAPGATKGLTVTLRQGLYTLWCPLGRHAAAGMKTSLLVGSASPIAPIVTTTNTATTPAGDTGGGGY